MQYKEWLQEWLESYVKLSSKQKTYTRYSEIVSGHLAIALGDYEMDDLTPLILQRYITELLQRGNLKTGQGLSANSVNGIITVIQNSLHCACGIGLLNENAANKIKRPKLREKEVTCFSATEQKKIEQAVLSDHKKPKMFGIVLCLYTGLRTGNCSRLRGRISISRKESYR